jgi:hypothetical protein
MDTAKRNMPMQPVPNGIILSRQRQVGGFPQPTRFPSDGPAASTSLSSGAKEQSNEQLRDP